MARDIKLRMWGIDNFSDYDAHTEYDDLGNPLPVMIYGDKLAFSCFMPINNLLKDTKEQKFMLYTGLMDAANKEIYEGDIVTYEPLWTKYKNILYGVVVWEDCEARFAIEWKFKAISYPPVSLASQADIIYVVGNIYENTNLLLNKED